MRISPIVLSAAIELACVGSSRMAQNEILTSSSSSNRNYSFEEIMIAAAVAGVSTGTTTTQKNSWRSQRKTELSTEFFLIPDVHNSHDNNSLSSVASVISVPAPNRTITVGHNMRNIGLNGGGGGDGSRIIPGVRLHGGIYSSGILRPRTWAMPLAALSAAAMLLMAAFEIFVLLKVKKQQ